MTPPGRPTRRAAQIPLAVTMGEPAGIGAEITLMAWRAARDRAEVTPGPFFVVDDPDRLQALSNRLGLDVPVAAIARPDEAAAAFGRALPVIPIALKAPVRTGTPDPANASAVLESIERAVASAQRGDAAAVVTNPIQKKVLYGAGFRHPGHTEFLADLAGAAEPPVMMLVCPGLRVVPVTVHVPLVKALAMLTTDMIVHAGRVTAAALKRDVGVAAPRLAVAAINPHAGEQGALGREEIDIIAPAADALRAEGIAVSGPDPADTMFHAEARSRYDAALCMYHDQALIPLKTIDFIHGVNVTLGLPFVRTSPDHGTALGIAGSGTASPASLIAALETARRMAEARARHDRQTVA
jgi:4-hydroxythreonine-4-phosphate dehydrogenase